VLAATEFSNPLFISGFTNDGYCREGMGYWNYGFGHYVTMGIAVRAATGGRLDILTGDKLRCASPRSQRLSDPAGPLALVTRTAAARRATRSGRSCGRSTPRPCAQTPPRSHC
jgi:hypothetical protein